MVNSKSFDLKGTVRRRRHGQKVLLSSNRILDLAAELRSVGSRAQPPELSHAEWQCIADALGHDESKIRFAAGSIMLSRGDAAWPFIMRSLRGGNVIVRRSAIHLLGRLPAKGRRSNDRRGYLIEALHDEDAKIRKNGAIAIGALEETAAEGPIAEQIASALIDAHSKDSHGWVRSSLILALGRSSDPRARKYLANYQEANNAALANNDAEDAASRDNLDAKDAKDPAKQHSSMEITDGEIEALRTALAPKMLDESSLPPLSWDGYLDMEMRGHQGFVDLLGSRAEALGIEDLSQSGAGWIAFRLENNLEKLWQLRLFREWRIPVAHSEGATRGDALSQVEDCLEGGELLVSLLKQVGIADLPLGFRISVEGSWGRAPRRDWLRPLARRVEKWLPGWKNAPSAYAIELGLSISTKGLRVWLRPGSVYDPRFSYRKKALPASLKPSVAAGIIALLNPEPNWRILDPCCGAGTLLCEAAAAGVKGLLVGVDRYPEAIRHSRVNLKAGGWRARLLEGDFRTTNIVSSFDAVVTNLPFGIRVSDHEANEAMYHALFDHLPHWLKPGGRALLLSQEIKLLEDCAAGGRHELKVVETRRISMGGLQPMAMLLSKE